MKRWTIAAIVIPSIVYAIACRQDVYVLTSPPAFEWHVLLRKTYSIVAFFLVGYLLRRALEENRRAHVVASCIGGIAAYSALIEVGQSIGGSQEGLEWNAFDTLCGALGGAIAVADRLFPALRRRR